MDLDTFVDQTREKKRKDLVNLTKKTKKQIPLYIFQAHANLVNKYPDAGNFLTPAFVYQTLREITKAAKDQLSSDENSSIDIFGLGKLYLKKKKAYRSKDANKEQYYLKFKSSSAFLYTIRKNLGTASEAELRFLEKSDNYMKELQRKRQEFLTQREMRKKEKESFIDPSEYLSDIF